MSTPAPFAPIAELLERSLSIRDRLFHIAVASEWAAGHDPYVPSRFAGEGFIHCSTSAQLAEVAGRLFRGRDDLVLVTIDPDRLESQVRHENLEGGQEQYPHIYGPLSRAAVVDCRSLRVGADGCASLSIRPVDSGG